MGLSAPMERKVHIPQDPVRPAGAYQRDIIITPGQRLSFQQDHFKYDGYTVLDTVIMGNKGCMR